MTLQVFISYKSEYRAFAEELHNNLLKWGYKPWLDVVDIPAGKEHGTKGWDEAIHDGMKSSEVVIGILTPESLQSENVLDEWGWALSAQRRLFLLWLKDVPEESIPPRYIRIQRIDLRRNQDEGWHKLKHALASPTLTVPTEDVIRPQRHSNPPISTDASNRGRMLQKVHEFWVEGVLENVLRESGSFDLELRATPNAVVRHADFGDAQLPTSAKVLEIFDDLNRELLILGAPGSGKTIMLLRLARELIERARERPDEPIPVIFNLSSWAVERKLLQDWLLDELRLKYQVPRRVGKEWIEREQILLLLDGLDEVVVEHRESCIEFINAFRHAYQAADVVVCSRTEDYELLRKRLNLAGAITLQPLSQDQTQDYLNRSELSGLRDVMAEDAMLQEMAKTPYLLNTMAFAYRGSSVVNVRLPTGQHTEADRRSHLFDRYVERRLRQVENKAYTPKQTRHYLSWLGEQMFKHRQTVFYIEGLQPGWLPTRGLYQVYPILAGFVFGLIPGITMGVVNGPLFGLTILIGLWAGFLLTRGSAFGLIIGLTVGLAFGMPGRWVLLSGNNPIPGFNMGNATLFGIVLGLILFLILRVTDFIRVDRRRIRIVETLDWSWSKALVGVGIGVLMGIIGMVVGAALTEPFRGRLFGLALGLTSGLVLSLGLAIAGTEVEIRVRPNQGIWYSGLNGLRVALFMGIGIGIINGPAIALALETGIKGIIVEGLTFGISLANVGIMFGGLTVIQHVVLRLLLWRTSKAPWNLAQFLNHASDVGLLRKVGGGYIFVHRSLLEYFAKLAA